MSVVLVVLFVSALIAAFFYSGSMRQKLLKLPRMAPGKRSYEAWRWVAHQYGFDFFARRDDQKIDADQGDLRLHGVIDGVEVEILGRRKPSWTRLEAKIAPSLEFSLKVSTCALKSEELFHVGDEAFDPFFNTTSDDIEGACRTLNAPVRKQLLHLRRHASDITLTSDSLVCLNDSKLLGEGKALSAMISQVLEVSVALRNARQLHQAQQLTASSFSKV